MSPVEIMRLPLAQGLQLRTIGLMKQDIKVKPRQGSNARIEAEEILGDNFDDWCMD
tara:strand:+ start:376 stop:543 length:168 start_codon:yes stop_codon:yes gene_type:complete